MGIETDKTQKQIKSLIAETFGNEIQREALEKLIFLVINLTKGETISLARYAPDKGEPQMEVCELYDEMKKEEARRGD